MEKVIVEAARLYGELLDKARNDLVYTTKLHNNLVEDIQVDIFENIKENNKEIYVQFKVNNIDFKEKITESNITNLSSCKNKAIEIILFKISEEVNNRVRKRLQEYASRNMD